MECFDVCENCVEGRRHGFDKSVEIVVDVDDSIVAVVAPVVDNDVVDAADDVVVLVDPDIHRPQSCLDILW